MNLRQALIAGSVIAAWALAVASLRLFDQMLEQPGSLSPLSPRVLWVCTLPAVISAMASAWWHTRRADGDPLAHNSLAARISGWSFPVFGVLFACAISLAEPTRLHEVSAGLSLFRDLATLAALVSICGLVFLFPFAFVLEYIVVRLIRARWPRAAFSGAAP